MLQNDHNETALVEGAKAGDAEAFGELYLLHLDPIFRYVYYRIGDLDDAEDLTEQVFLKAWEALPGYNYRGNPFSSWLYRIAHNVVIDHHRRQKPEVPIELGNQEEIETRDQKSALTEIIETEEADILAAAISQLPDDQQQVIILRFIEGLNHGDIARIMEKTEGACRMLQHRALVTLSGMLKPAKG
jgi:RNA polymerase sigma-70 factor (ECF subfamily)